MPTFGKCIIGGKSQQYKPKRKTKRRTCGRPFAPELTVRAGGSIGRTASVVPCCQTLGPPNEEKSILGHLDKSSFEEVYFGEAYENLRKAHEQKNFDKIEYCKNCDFLYEDPEAIVWTNDENHKLYNMLGTGEDFILTEYKDRKKLPKQFENPRYKKILSSIKYFLKNNQSMQ